MAERVLCQLAVSFVLGILASGQNFWLLLLVWLLFLAYLVAAIYRNSFISKKNAAAVVRLLLCLLVFLTGYCKNEVKLAAVSRGEALLAEGKEIAVKGRLYKKEEKNEQYIYYIKDAQITGQSDKSNYHFLIYLDADIHQIGTTLLVSGNCKLFKNAANEGNFDEKNYYRSKDILCAITSPKMTVLQKGNGFAQGLYQLRIKIRAIYEQLLPQAQAGTLSIMALGDKGGLDSEIKQLYQQAGISHTLAISGLHISILGVGVLGFLRKCRLGMLPAGLISMFLVYSFGTLSGMEVSSYRAVLMFFLMMVGRQLGVTYDAVTALACCLLLALWENPFVLGYAGFLFSYVAVLGAVVVMQILKSAWKVSRQKKKKMPLPSIRLLGKLVQTMVASGCIQLAVLPLSVYFYYEYPVYGVLINGLLLPFMSPLLLSGLAGGVLGLFHPTLGYIALRPAAFLLSWNEWICRQFQKLRGFVSITGRPGLEMMVLYYLVLVGALAFLWKWKRNRECLACQLRPETKDLQKNKGFDFGFWIKFNKGRLLLTLLPVAVLIAMLYLRPVPEFAVTFLDVGQGDGVYIRSEEGKNFFLDGGSSDESKIGQYRILPFLKFHGISAIDGWFVSHADADHVSGLMELWKLGYPIKSLLLAEGMVKDEAWQELIKLADDAGTQVIYVGPGDCVGTESLKFTCLYPGAVADKNTMVAEADRNGASLVLELENKQGFRALFTGDISTEQEQDMLTEKKVKKVHLYKAAHHGSKNSNNLEFLQAVNPFVTVISCGANNRYGHPAAEAVKRITQSGSIIFYTMKEGQVTIRYHNKRIYVEFPMRQEDKI